MRDVLLALVTAFTDSGRGQMTLSRLGPDTYPDPARTSYNDMVSWRVTLTFGRGYFTGAVVTHTGLWAAPHGPDGRYEYHEVSRDLPVGQAVDAFLSDELPPAQ